MEKIGRWNCSKNFYEKLLTGTLFVLAPAANHVWFKLFFYWLHETAACCYFGVDMRKGLDHYSLCRLTDGIPHSSSDLLYFILLLPFTCTNSLKSNFFSPFRFLGQKFSMSDFSAFFSLDEKILSPTSISEKYSVPIPKKNVLVS